MAGTAPPAADRARDVVDLGLEACRAYGREDLAARLRTARATLDDPRVHVVVVGDFKQGKSSLVNALIGAEVCPVDDDVATALPTYVEHGETRSAEVLWAGDPPRREPVGLEAAARLIMEPDPSAPAAAGPLETAPVDADSARPSGVVVRLPRTLLRGGLVLVDTPGVGGLESAHAAASLAAVAMADAVLFVTDASQELTAVEAEFVRKVRDSGPELVCVLTKTDLYPAWRTIADLDRGHLENTAPGVPVLPVSSALRSRSVPAKDKELNAESGFGDVVRFVSGRVAGGAAQRVAASAAAEVVQVAGQVATQFEAEDAVLADPDRVREVMAGLERAQARAAELRGSAARWNQTLSDGVADLTADVDHDLRARVRRLLDAADDWIERADPADVWPQLKSWLEAAVAQEMVASYTSLRTRAGELSEQVWTHFSEAAEPVLSDLAVRTPEQLLARLDVRQRLDLARMSVRKQALTALKGSYLGVLMFTALGGLIGLSLGPVAVGIGLAMGLGSLRQEKKRQLENRRGQARNAVRRYCDEAAFRVGKDSRDTMRRVQRQLRDHYAARADEIQRSTTDSLRAATEAARSDEKDRARRRKDIAAELGRLAELSRRAGEVAA
ncbi:dynamin family protein [Promicromonospora sp. CA-289599]|uniref:dynamin family protein n=1 Tax=Promicromonospora sp. CA-289599 TaxID=3240014 RepID=UPI003D89FF43